MGASGNARGVLFAMRTELSLPVAVFMLKGSGLIYY